MKYLIVDAFSEVAFGGNPAGGVLLEKNQVLKHILNNKQNDTHYKYLKKYKKEQ